MEKKPRLPLEVTEKPRKRGRPPKLSREIVTAIQSATGTQQEIADRYNTSLSTVGRIRSEWYDYVTENEEGSASSYRVPDRKTYRLLTADERRKIAEDVRPTKEVANEWGVSRSYVAKLRVLHGTTHRTQKMLVAHVYDAIVTSEVSDAVLADRYGLPEAAVKAIRDAHNAKKDSS